MTGYLPQSVKDELAAAHRQNRRRKARRVVHVGDEAFPILEFTEDGFSIDVEDAPNLRGLIDIFEGPRHLYQALIVASARDGDVMRYEFKRNTAAANSAALDFETEADRPIALLPRA